MAVADTDQDGEAMPLSFIDVDELTTHGVLKCDIKKLQDAGIMTADAVIMTSKRQLAKIKGISDAKVEKIFTGASKIAAKRLCFQSASDLAAQRQAEVIRITTGCRDLDNIVGGGIETMSITELYGEFRTGKSQLCHTLAVSCLTPEEQGGAAGVFLTLTHFPHMSRPIFPKHRRHFFCVQAASSGSIQRVPSVRSASRRSRGVLVCLQRWCSTTSRPLAFTRPTTSSSSSRLARL